MMGPANSTDLVGPAAGATWVLDNTDLAAPVLTGSAPARVRAAGERGHAERRPRPVRRRRGAVRHLRAPQVREGQGQGRRREGPGSRPGPSREGWEGDSAWKAFAYFNGFVGVTSMIGAVVLTLWSLWLYLRRYGKQVARLA